MNDTNGLRHLHAVEDDAQIDFGQSGSHPSDPAGRFGPGPLEIESPASMDDKDVHRLEDRIEASEERGRLRLETAMARTDGKLDTITALLQEFGRQIRTQAVELGQRTDAQAHEFNRRMDESGRRSDVIAAEMATRHRDLRNTVIATGLVVLFGVIATLIGLKQVWIGGVEIGVPIGQSMQPAAIPPPPAQRQAVPAQPAPATTPPHGTSGK